MAKKPGAGGREPPTRPVVGKAPAGKVHGLAAMRAKIRELEQDKRLLRDALERCERQLKGRGAKS